MKYRIPLYSLIAVAVVGLLIFLMSLDDGKTSGATSYQNEATGADGELVLVVPKEPEDRTVGDSIASFFQRRIPTLPPPSQPYFDVVRMARSDLEGLVKQHRKIFMVDIGKDHDHAAKLGIGEDQWANGQILFRLTGNDKDSAIKNFSERAEWIRERLLKAERERIMEQVTGRRSGKIREKLLKEHGTALDIPKGFEFKKNEERFAWLERYRQIPRGGRQRDLMQGILIYYYPYKGGKQFEKDRLLAVRDSVLRKHVPGPSEGSYMGTEDRWPEVDPDHEEFEFKGEYAAKIRGLWRVENDFMGGPFISLSTYDEARDRLVTVEGFVYGPNFDKRDYIRRMEAILYTLEFSDPPSS